uniref:Uncharacterized protein n=1 Tax=Vitis vinifera TaxID=29760 RepID=F6HP32_VITVI
MLNITQYPHNTIKHLHYHAWPNMMWKIKSRIPPQWSNIIVLGNMKMTLPAWSQNG